jgi:arginyl-tRNA synthetase
LEGLLSVGYSRYGSEEKLLEDPIQHLYEVYVKVNKVKAEENEALEKEHAAKGGEGYAPPGPTTVESRAVFKAMEDGKPLRLNRPLPLQVTPRPSSNGPVSVNFRLKSSRRPTLV